MSGFIDRHRAGRLMRDEGLAALVLCQPETILYAAGAFAGVASYWRRAGAAFLLVPADPDAPMTAIVGDLQAQSFAAQSGLSDVRSHRIWVETDRFPFDDQKPARSPRPAQYELAASLGLLADAMGERGLAGERIGLELGFVPVTDFAAFERLDCVWADCTRLVERLRAVKHPVEIARLRHAAECASAGLSELIDRIVPGQTAADMTGIFRQASAASATVRGLVPPQSAWAYIAVGGDGFAPGGAARSGDIIKIDIGCVVDGYSSDGARTVVLGPPRPEAQKVHDDLLAAFETGLALLAPGRPLAEIYRAVAGSMWKAGHETYGRGHFGHGVGGSIWSEEWPFISDSSDAVLEEGMMMAFETPWYIDGLGGFIIEDQFLVTGTGIDIIAPLPRTLRQV